jgi:hypothetical protein
MLDNFQYQSHKVDTDNITKRDQTENVKLSDELKYRNTKIQKMSQPHIWTRLAPRTYKLHHLLGWCGTPPPIFFINHH